jgi:sugar/nucleoside kinase (ribokinase family)
MALDAYLYGMTVLSTIHRVASGGGLVDGYGEIVESYVCPGGEAMNGALLLSGLGLTTALAGPHWGTETHELLGRYAVRHRIDVGGVRIVEDYPGLRDLVIVSGEQRSVLGWFGRFFSEQPQRWSEPDASAVERARVVAVDPFFGASSVRAARLARRFGKPYVTIDCEHDSELHAHAAATIVSREYRARRYPGLDDEETFARYTARGESLTIFSSGSNDLVYARGCRPSARFTPFRVDVKSTLGAGDAFRAGIVFGVANGFDDTRSVRFASGLAALACTRLPIADCLPSLADVESFLAERRA